MRGKDIKEERKKGSRVYTLQESQRELREGQEAARYGRVLKKGNDLTGLL